MEHLVVLEMRGSMGAEQLRSMPRNLHALTSVFPVPLSPRSSTDAVLPSSLTTRSIIMTRSSWAAWREGRRGMAPRGAAEGGAPPRCCTGWGLLAAQGCSNRPRRSSTERSSSRIDGWGPAACCPSGCAVPAWARWSVGSKALT